ncbi:DUF2254 family protein [Cellulosimicrobium arenosum]|uniref:DUF2254 domain-containing protein n=1 Tax=Cellulosimicrobium arenosum TaxID=2708133 RepID=A0A927G7E8_9MICO|nr:DUF2254 domain-containing protein [Cellulosimicrobium arenosum]
MRIAWRRALDSFWFYPAVLSTVAVVVAEVLIGVDRALAEDSFEDVTLLSSLSAGGSRALLSAIATSVLTVTGTTFSITISVLATTTSSYGPRLVRNFMSDRGNQLVLGVFTASFLYSLVVLRAVRSETDDGDAFVPTLAVNGAMLLAVLSVAVLVYFIHHIADSVQVSTLQRRLRDDLGAVVELLAPAQAGPADVGPQHTGPQDLPPVRDVVAADRSGYVQRVDVDRLLRLAEASDGLVECVVRSGDHVAVGEPVVRLRAHGTFADDGARGVRAAVTLGDERTPHQDLEYAVQQLTDMAVRALSPGTNDPYTAASAFDALGDGLARLAGRPPVPPGRADAGGTLRVVVPWPQAEELIAQVLVAVRCYAVDAPVALGAALRLVERIARVAEGPTTRSLVRDEVRALHEAVARSSLQERDRLGIERRVDEVLTTLA